jgi:hypothetical protein
MAVLKILLRTVHTLLNQPEGYLLQPFFSVRAIWYNASAKVINFGLPKGGDCLNRISSLFLDLRCIFVKLPYCIR